MSSQYAVRRALVLMGLLVAGLSTVVRATPDADFETRREQERKNYDIMIGQMPLLDVHRLSDILHLSVENKELIVRTELPSTASDAYMRVKFADRDCAGLVRIQGGMQPPAHVAVVPRLLQFNLTDYTQPLRITTISINTQVSYCSISKSSQFPGGVFRNTSIIQQASRVSDGGGSIHLTVDEVAQDSTPIHIELLANDFFSLVHGHREECDAYIRPLLRDLGQEGLFTPDPMVAWQVFSETWNADPAITLQVQKLLPGLDVDDFHVRTEASRALDKLGREGAAVLIHLDRSKLTPEQNARVDLALAPYAQLPGKEAVHLRSDPTFLLDCLYSDDEALKKVALAHLRQIADPTIQFDLNADPAARNAAIAALRIRLVAGPKQ